ncbi:hypothetical protein [Clostridium formicaceticum]|uniref:Uncharacterized protein n=1 Tax=Clostridium formicaceticum TaxID=1497 RepID=A0AAC9RPT3_9CLOT|nr:hypothetical protein [Clostridium formicaceticum]AOY77529.1 hypothetical protein BJL90_17715 [Clostridium formicaceticum]ARE88100.1 hypothetical protein CLFO_25010 [Clostridium formicaceticum]
MAEIVNAKGGYTLDFIMVPSQHIGQFNDFMAEYGDKSDYEIFQEIAETKSQLSQDLLSLHIKNLDSLSQMNGFVTDVTEQRIAAVKEILTEGTDSSNSGSSVDSRFFFGGTSLLLWFLILAAIWRRPFGGFGRFSGFGGGFFGRPFY